MSDEEIRAFNEAEQRIIDNCTKTITLYKKEEIEKLSNKIEEEYNTSTDIFVVSDMVKKELNHYKLLYQKVKERNDELKTRIQNEKYKNRCHCSSCDYYFLKELEKILEGESNE